MRSKHSIAPLCLVALLAGCGFPWIHHVDINQGNIVNQEAVNQLRPGMNRRQVTYLLGTPLLNDPFHDNRWDYVYSVERQGEPRQEKHITLVFERDELILLEGGFRPGVQPAVDASRDATIYIPKIERDKTVWQKMKGIFTDD